MTTTTTGKRVEKLYSKLTPQEQAALAFESASRLDWEEVDRILDGVELQDYRGVHMEYRRRAMGFYVLTGVFGIAYWKNLAFAYICHKVGEDKDCEKFFTRLNAVEKALTGVCQRYGVSVESFRRVAECLPAYEFPDYLDDNDVTQRYVELFTSAVEQ